MIEQNEPSPSQDDVLGFLDNFNAKCPVCGESNWGLLPAETPLSIPLNDQGGLRMELKGVKIYGVVCITCGLVRAHSTTIVNKRISEGADNGNG